MVSAYKRMRNGIEEKYADTAQSVSVDNTKNSGSDGVAIVLNIVFQGSAHVVGGGGVPAKSRTANQQHRV